MKFFLNFSTTFFILLATVLLLAGCGESKNDSNKPVPTKSELSAQWPPLLKKADYSGARTLCEGWFDFRNEAVHTEAHKCLAAITYSEAREKFLKERQAGEHATKLPLFYSRAVDKALEHFNKALSLSPKDLQAHQGRIALLIGAGRAADVPKYLKKSIPAYGDNSNRGLNIWIKAINPLFKANQIKPTLSCNIVIEKFYPDSDQVKGNIGSLLTMIGRKEEALTYFKKAIEMNPASPANSWNLARNYDDADDLELAEKYYWQTTKLEKNEEKKKRVNCAFAEFVDKKLKNKKRACKMQKANCPVERQTACGK